MHVNTHVVKALMHLRGIDETTLANLISVSRPDMHDWLYDIGEDSEERVPFDTQLEALKTLGINGDVPRPDVVHYWRVYEPLFSREADPYWALQILLKAFGKAQAVFIAREADPAFSWTAKAHFGLRFPTFYAILEVSAHPLKSITFDPDTMPDMSWVPDTMGVLLPDAEYDRLEPGAMKVRGLQQYLTYNAEVQQWERLRDAALEKGILAEQVASMLLGTSVPAHEALEEKEEPLVTVVETTSKKVEPTLKVAQPAALPDTRAEQDELRLFVTPVKAPDAVRARHTA